jgi:uncharacterized protein YyaL (SSP411 family)
MVKYVLVLLSLIGAALLVGEEKVMSERRGSQRASRAGNRLCNEKSPYLLQHADNPVDWYPWGEKAFEEARKADKPIFLSIGYSTCHWCHVMERESFEDQEVAGLMNDAFICVKVDREERPDIDQVYMTACQMMTGSGGWPLTIIMTPDQVPFFAATYIPKDNRFGRAGMLELIPRIRTIWNTRRDEIMKTAGSVASALQEMSADRQGDELDASILEIATEQLTRRFDVQHGGFGGAPKFPTPHNLSFLLRQWKRTGNQQLLSMVEETLLKMRRGGIHDHIGFGFHRYSTDERWLLPHFEKMLYDQALLMLAYSEAYQATGKEVYARAASEIATYILRDMQSPEGAFYSAEDADSEGEEGRFYLWTEDEVRQVLPADEADLVVRAFNVEPNGNFRDEATGHRSGANILHTDKSLEDLALELETDVEELGHRLDAARQKLYLYREKRIHPYKDDKILTDWNGLMIAALAKAGSVLDKPEYVDAAGGAADFILAQMRQGDGRLLHRYREGSAQIRANLNDYAFLVWGLIEIYEADFDVAYLEAALHLSELTLRHFWDDENGGFYFTPDDGEQLLVRRKEAYDGAIPSGNSVAMLNLLRLSRMTGDPDLETHAWKISKSVSGAVKQTPVGHTQFLSAVDFGLGPTYEVVIAGKADEGDTRAMLRALGSRFIPNSVVLLRPDGAESSEITRLAEFTRFHSSTDGKATAYVCRNYNCELPTTEVGQMLKLLGSLPSEK